jgi:hypothetical protein
VLYLPAEPNGFCAEDKQGAYRLYVVAAERPVQALETLNERYVRPALWLDRRRSKALLLEWLDALVGDQIAGAQGWTLEFEVR